MADLQLPDAQQILRRAVQLDGALPPPQTMGLAELEAAAGELGLDPMAVAMAVAERRAGVDDRTTGRRLDRAIGPRRIVVVRRSGVPADDAERLTAEWLERAHVLKVARGADGIVVARRRTDALAGASRAVRSISGSGALSSVRELRGAGATLADGTHALCLHADIGDSRTKAVLGGVGVGVVTAAGVTVATLLLSPFAVAAAPVAVVAGFVTARAGHRSKVRTIGEALEETAAAATTGAAPPPPLASLGRGLKRITGR